ncbi:hypothetical protein Dda_9260 [Drechslerella dactyloides]|uniref:Uncharacterized protein n=1 Tax=Drechslerella dactyloides TaxID=74499 RepID=A0AAD6NFB9_DREDA|nr:hypothetical protein Dda_9260 [Drechslerella dactyloides]
MENKHPQAVNADKKDKSFKSITRRMSVKAKAGLRTVSQSFKARSTATKKKSTLAHDTAVADDMQIGVREAGTVYKSPDAPDDGGKGGEGGGGGGGGGLGPFDRMKGGTIRLVPKSPIPSPVPP